MWPSEGKLATVPTNEESNVTTRTVLAGEFLTVAMWASKAHRSLGSGAVKAAIATNAGSRIISKIASRSELLIARRTI